MTNSVLRWGDVAHIKSYFSFCGFIRIRGPSVLIWVMKKQVVKLLIRSYFKKFIKRRIKMQKQIFVHKSKAMSTEDEELLQQLSDCVYYEDREELRRIIDRVGISRVKKVVKEGHKVLDVILYYSNKEKMEEVAESVLEKVWQSFN